MERFVIGTGRCGSTLLSKMLAVSPEMASIFEFFNGLHGTGRFSREEITPDAFWDSITQPHAFITLASSRGYRVDEVDYPFDRPGMRYSRADYLPWILVATLPRLSDDPDRLFDGAKEFVLRQPTKARAEHYTDFFSWLARKSGASMWNERSGSGIDYTGDLADLFPDGRFLHIHREGEEAALSMREHALFRLAVTIVYDLDPEMDLVELLNHVICEPGKPDPLREFLERRPAAEHFGRFWADQLATGFRAVQKLRPEQYREVRFEDLVLSPAETLLEIADFFEMDPDVGGWIPKAASLVRGMPPSRLESLAPEEAERLVTACRTGNRLLDRSDSSRAAGVELRKHSRDRQSP